MAMHDRIQRAWEDAVARDVRDRGVRSEAVLRALRDTPRADFLPETLREEAAVDGPLSIGSGQTISQPYIVGLMTEWAAPEPGHTVLEIGTGSGFQAAVLSKLVRRVYTVERIQGLARDAEQRFQRLGLGNIHVRAGDGYEGWPEAAPFDAVVATAACEEVPEPWWRQIRPGGRLVVPIGPPHGEQVLIVYETQPGGARRALHRLPVRFVPFVRGPGCE